MGSQGVTILDYRALGLGDFGQQSSSLRRQIIADCCKGKIVILRNVDLGVDLAEFKMASSLPSSLCKIGIERGQQEVDSDFHADLPFRLVYPGADKLSSPFLNKRDLTEVCDRSFDGDWSRLRQFFGSCDEAATNLRAVARRILHDVPYYDDCAVMRFALPRVCKMHLDPNPNWEKKEALRIFVNLDEQPRQWRHSVNVFDFVERYYDQLDLGRYFDIATGDGLTKLAQAITKSPEFQNAPTTAFEFQPKDVWLFDGRIIGHQLVAGRGAMSLTAKIRDTGLPDHFPSLRDRLYAIHKRKQFETSARSKQSGNFGWQFHPAPGDGEGINKAAAHEKAL